MRGQVLEELREARGEVPGAECADGAARQHECWEVEECGEMAMGMEEYARVHRRSICMAYKGAGMR